MQQTQFTGNLGKDAEIRNTNGTDVCNFSVAVRHGIGRDAPTEWMRCSIWGQQGKALLQYLTKGAKVAVAGALTIKTFEGKKQFDVKVSDIDPFCGGNREQSQSQPKATTTAPMAHNLDDDVPF